MATSVANVMFTNAVYFPNYKIYNGASPGMMNYGCISHVFYAFASVASDGSVFVRLSFLSRKVYAEFRELIPGRS